MIGTTIGHYRVLSKLGSGGMGIVYEAEDLDLHRRVALKFLPDSLAGDPAALERFLLEARSASALNHPNICTIYAVERDDSRHFIAMELLEGDTLDRRILHHPLSVEAMLDLCIQVADALDTAHHKGIIHRDIKPGNIFITTSGRAKVVDFGLAKITKASLAQTIGAGGPTAAFATSPGSTVGTVAYMSPEQARGDELDPRSDLFSFGAVMYQMATGAVPFEGATSAVIFSGILDKSHTPPLDKNPELPAKLGEIIDRALEKDKDLRFQTAAEIRAELKRLKRDTSSGKSSVAVVPKSRSASPASSSSAILISEAKRHKTGLFIGAGVLTLILIAAGFGIFSAVRGKPEDKSARGDLTIKRLTSSTKGMNTISISPDGKYIAYNQHDKGKNSVWIYQVVTGSSVRLVPETEDFVGQTAFSPDGNFVYYNRQNATAFAQGTLFAIPTLGGDSRKLLDNISSPVSFSPDDKQMAFTRLTDKQKNSELVIANKDGSGIRALASLKADKNWFAQNGPSWSPDGRFVAVARKTVEGGFGAYATIYEVATGTEKMLSPKKWQGLNRIVWRHDGTGLIASAEDKISINGAQLWQFSYPDGNVSRITNDLNGYGATSLGISQDDKSIATIQTTLNSNIWSVDSSKAKQITSGTAPIGLPGVRLLPDGRVLYVADSEAGLALWISDVNGATRQISEAGLIVFQICADRDGKTVVFTGAKGSGLGIWRMNVDGSDLRQLTKGFADQQISISPDGSTIIFGRWIDGKPNLWKVDANGSAPVQITSRQSDYPFISPDGKSIAAMLWDESQNRWRKAIFPIAGGEPTKVFDLPETADWTIARWSLDGQAIVYSDNKDGIGNLWMLPLTGAPAKKVTSFTSEEIFNFDVGQKPNQYVVSRGNIRSDLILIQNFR